MKHSLIYVMTAIILGCTSACADLSIGGAYYRGTNGSVHLLVRNNLSEWVRLRPPIVNGFDTSKLDRSASRSREILWYRCRPNPIPPHGMADVTVVLPETSPEQITVELPTSTGKVLRHVVKCAPESLRFQAVRFGPDLRTVYVYLRSESPIKRLRLDGMDVRRYASAWPIKMADGLGFVCLVLPKPLSKGSFHILEAESVRASTFCQVRVIPSQFLVGVYGSVTPENITDWAQHGCNHYLSFGWINPTDIGLMERQGISVGLKAIPAPLVDRGTGQVVAFDEATARERIREVNNQPGFLYHHMVDEPDVADYYAGRWLGSTAMELAARVEFSERIDPEHFTFIQLDNTFRPNNYRVYGESADVLATHRYSLGNYVRTEAGQEAVKRTAFMDDLVETLERFRLATEPRLFFMVPQFFNLGPGRKGRAPTIAEMRLQCYAMIAGGACGLIHYIHSGSSGGGEGARSKDLWDAMTDLHRELRSVGEILAVATPAPKEWARTNTPNVSATLLLSGNRMLVVLINRAHRSTLEQFISRPVHSVTVTLRIPPWVKHRKMKAFPVGSGSAIPVTIEGETASFFVDEVADATCFVLDSQRPWDNRSLDAVNK